MRILVLGANGFIGSRLVAALPQFADNPDIGRNTQIIASDLRAPGATWRADHAKQAAAAGNGIGLANAPPADDAIIQFVEGDLLAPDLLDSLFVEPFDVVFHLASALTFDAEIDFKRGLQVNVHALMQLLEHCRKQGRPSKFLFASSISTFGGLLPDVVDDFVFQTPQTSYGTHKVIAEQLINDYSRRGFIDGRVLRLPIVLTHPGPPTSSVSDRVASLIREPLNGRDAVCPLAPDTRMPVASVDAVVNAFLRLCELPAAVFGATRALNLPALTVTPAQLARSVARHASMRRLGSLTWEPDASMQAVVDSWPKRFISTFATENNIHGDASVDEIVDAYLETLNGRL